jgi:predicted LPLAT superfamily acyltransferase
MRAVTPEPAGAPPAAPDWKAATHERGAGFMLRFMIWIARHTNRAITRWVTLPPTVLYFFATAGEARRASRQFLGRALGRAAGAWDVVRHFWTFATVVQDRMLIAIGGFRDLVLDEGDRNAAERQATYNSPRGSLLFVSHLGSFEALREVGSSRQRMKLVLDREHGRQLTAMLGALKPEAAAMIIDAGQPGPALALAVRQALDDGYRVGMMVDRAAPGEKTVRVPFLGADAAFPAGPWLLAAALQARVILGFCVFRGGRKYQGHFELFTEKLEIPRAARQAEVEACVRRYAARLEHHARDAPYNWFNFYDFWR